MTDTAFYGNMVTVAKNLLAQFGQTVTFTSVVVGTYDPATGAAPKTETTYQVNGAIFDIAADRVDGTTILQSDRRLVLSARTTTGGTFPAPKADDFFTVGGVQYSDDNALILDTAKGEKV
ncbi:MAG TPA: hypothetical protein PKL84_10460, partial [Candidatus Hydrogenedentes bacterium]|nr:hypothetical protein [Candidatus Hydrogenedentota bacterium]